MLVADQPATDSNMHAPRPIVLTPARAAGNYRADIDGLRAVAVSSVVLFHAGLGFPGGFAGVDVFFVISGYLIGGIIDAAVRERRFSFVEFYARRARRILPALLLVVGVTLLLGWMLLGPTEYAKAAATGAAAFVGWSNIELWRSLSYFEPDAQLNPFLMTWSLGVEEQFYLVFPWLMLALGRLGRRVQIAAIATLSAISFAGGVWLTSSHPPAAFYLLPSRAWELGLGVLLAMCISGDRPAQKPWLQNATSVAGLLLITASSFMLTSNTPFPGYAALAPAAGATALIYSRDSYLNRKVLASRPFVFVGLVSYSWYLWHWPLLTLVRIAAVAEPPPLALPLVAALSFGLAILSWRYVETPFRVRQIPSGQSLFRYAGFVSAAVAVAVSIWALRGVPQRTPAAAEVAAQVAAWKAYPCFTPWGNTEPSRSPQCHGDSPGLPTVALIGDSHAAALGPGLRKIAQARGWSAEIWSLSSCRPLLGVTTWSAYWAPLKEECAAFMRKAITRAAADPNIKLILFAGAWPNADPWPTDRLELIGNQQSGATQPQLLERGLRESVKAATRPGKRVVLMRDVPLWPFDPVGFALGEIIPARGLLLKAIGQDPSAVPASARLINSAADPVLRRVAAATGAEYYDSWATLCPGGRCGMREGRALLYMDASHVTPRGGELVLRNLSFPEF